MNRPVLQHSALLHVPLHNIWLIKHIPVVNMNGVNGIVGLPGLWQEARNTDGRVYYYNTQTKATQWTKPIELMLPAEVRCITS